MSTDKERLARLETNHDNLNEDFIEVLQVLKELNAQVADINTKMTANRGFLAGMAFAFSLLGTLIGLGLHKILP